MAQSRYGNSSAADFDCQRQGRFAEPSLAFNQAGVFSESAQHFYQFKGTVPTPLSPVF